MNFLPNDITELIKREYFRYKYDDVINEIKTIKYKDTHFDEYDEDDRSISIKFKSKDGVKFVFEYDMTSSSGVSVKGNGIYISLSHSWMNLDNDEGSFIETGTNGDVGPNYDFLSFDGKDHYTESKDVFKKTVQEWKEFLI